MHPYPLESMHFISSGYIYWVFSIAFDGQSSKWDGLHNQEAMVHNVHLFPKWRMREKDNMQEILLNFMYKKEGERAGQTCMNSIYKRTLLYTRCLMKWVRNAPTSIEFHVEENSIIGRIVPQMLMKWPSQGQGNRHQVLLNSIYKPLH